MASLADLDIFRPEFIKVLFNQVEPPTRLYKDLFRSPTNMGLYQFSVGTFSDPFAILPPVEDLEDAKSMFREQSIVNYVLQDYRGYVDISNKLINQYKGAGNMKGLINVLREFYMSGLREGYDNTIEFTCFRAMDSRAATVPGTTDWTLTATTASHIYNDIVNARRNYISATRSRPTTAINNEFAMAELLKRQEISGQMHTGKDALVTGSLGRLFGMDFLEQAGGYTDHEGTPLTMFQPTTQNKGLTYILNPVTFGYPVVFGSPEFKAEDNVSKNSVRIFVNAHAGFVFNKGTVARITA